MIVNLPDADALTETALRLYFDAWDRVRSILNGWDKPLHSVWLTSVVQRWVFSDRGCRDLPKVDVARYGWT